MDGPFKHGENSQQSQMALATLQSPRAHPLGDKDLPLGLTDMVSSLLEPFLLVWRALLHRWGEYSLLILASSTGHRTRPLPFL